MPSGNAALVSLVAMVGIDDQPLDADREQLIEGKADERLAENRDQRLGPVLGDRPQARAQPGAQHKSVFNGRIRYGHERGKSAHFIAYAPGAKAFGAPRPGVLPSARRRQKVSA